MGRVPREGQGPVAHHRLTRRRTRASLHHTVDILDLRTGTIHLLTSAAAGTNHTGRYFALCGADIIRADLTDPGFRHYRLVMPVHHPEAKIGNVTTPAGPCG
jgi:hypothetical protein